jgi:hypothetical protein
MSFEAESNSEMLVVIGFSFDSEQVFQVSNGYL